MPSLISDPNKRFERNGQESGCSVIQTKLNYLMFTFTESTSNLKRSRKLRVATVLTPATQS
jgi:hypothetical protein